MQKKETVSNNTNYIQPYRIIPFDIGCKITEKKLIKIEEALKDYEKIEEELFIKKLSDDYLVAFQINDRIKLYIYQFGVGVFSIKDKQYNIKKENYAINYCHTRKTNHFSILSFEHRYSKKIEEIMDIVRKSIYDKKEKIRLTSLNTWENNGLSYVMTISFLVNKNQEVNYDKMSTLDKKNILIMLEPSIVHEEDSLVISLDEKKSIKSLYDFNPDLFPPVKNWLKNKHIGVYISWASILIIMNKWDEQYYSFIEELEVDLQAMWLYTYSLYQEALLTNEKKKVSELKRNLYEFNRKYNEFKEISDTSMPTYLPSIRNEMINTSKIEEEKEKYIQYVEFCIEEITSINNENQKKYSWLNEILLFLIAFVQIAPMLYNFLLGNYKDLILWPIIVMLLLVIIGIIIIIRKD